LTALILFDLFLATRAVALDGQWSFGELLSI
jgi:hypothetical protein